MPMLRRPSAVLPCPFVLALAALASSCDDDKMPRTDAAANSDGGQTGGMVGAGGAAGGGGTAAAGGAAGGVAFIDTDVVLARFNADGTPDTTFGNAGTGVARVDLGTGALVGSSPVRDAPWGIEKDAQDRLVVFSARKSTGPGRVDADRVAVRLSPNGAVDTTFGDSGIHTLSIGTLSDSARNGIIDPDGKIVTAGYTSQPTGVGTQTANRLVIARLHGGTAAAGVGGAGGRGTAGAGGAAGAAGAGGAGGAAGAAGGATAAAPGTLDNTFGVMGIVNYNPFSSSDPLKEWGMAEAYGIARQSTGAYVTAGYGRSAASGTVNVVSFRFTATGAFDTTWGTTGIFERDIASDNDRGRSIVTLPGDRLLIAGSATAATNNVDAMLMILTASGALDTSFNATGYKVYKIDPTSDRPDESLFGAAVSPNSMFAAAAGYRDAGATAGNNDDATLVILPLGATGVEFAKAVPLSATAHDRFSSVTFDANNRIVAAGFVAEGTDQWLAVARFNTDGTPDTNFGTGGFAKINAAVAGTLEDARGVVVQSDGKIVVVGSAEH